MAAGAEPASRYLVWEASRGAPLRRALKEADPAVVLLVGPEGGFSEEEAAAAQVAGFQPVGLGPLILRTETAAIVAVSLASAAAGGLD